MTFSMHAASVGWLVNMIDMVMFQGYGPVHTTAIELADIGAETRAEPEPDRGQQVSVEHFKNIL